jgi:hypothetical protein
MVSRNKLSKAPGEVATVLKDAVQFLRIPKESCSLPQAVPQDRLLFLGKSLTSA